MAKWLYFPKQGFDKHIGRPRHQVYHTNAGVKEIWFRFADETV